MAKGASTQIMALMMTRIWWATAMRMIFGALPFKHILSCLAVMVPIHVVRDRQSQATVQGSATAEGALAPTRAPTLGRGDISKRLGWPTRKPRSCASSFGTLGSKIEKVNITQAATSWSDRRDSFVLVEKCQCAKIEPAPAGRFMQAALIFASKLPS